MVVGIEVDGACGRPVTDGVEVVPVDIDGTTATHGYVDLAASRCGTRCSIRATCSIPCATQLTAVTCPVERTGSKVDGQRGSAGEYTYVVAALDDGNVLCTSNGGT